MKIIKSEAPWWLKRALLGTCYWMGHRRALYREYPLGESAIVAELCNLIYANLPAGKRLICEAQYSEFLDITAIEAKETVFTEKSRVDLCVCEQVAKGRDPLKKLEFVFEVKRGLAANANVDKDLLRLLELKTARPDVRAFLLLVSEGSRPTRFVRDDSKAVRKKLPIAETDGACYVRAVMKAISVTSTYDTAHYGCAIEVMAPDADEISAAGDVA